MGKHNRTRIALKKLPELKRFAAKFLKNFESDLCIAERRATMLRAFEELGLHDSEPYLSYLKCTSTSPCDVGGCPKCDAVHRMATANQFVKRINAMVDQGARPIAFTGILKEHRLSATELKRLDWSKVRDRIRKTYVRHVGDRYQTFAWMSLDISCERLKDAKVPYYAPHIHGIICVWGYDDATDAKWESVKRNIRKRLKRGLFPEDELVKKPVEMANLFNVANWVTYGMKTAFSILGSFKPPSLSRAKLDVPIREAMSRMTRRQRYIEINTKGRE